MNFSARLSELVTRRESQIVLGLDPHPDRLWPTGSTPQSAGVAVSDHCKRAIDAVAEQCVAIKPQLACFERLGAPGWEALQTVIGYAHDAELLVIADGKRGDVPVTAEVYKDSFLNLEADALTVNPLLGIDSLEPYLQAAATEDMGVFVLVRTSNPGSSDFEDLELASGERLWERVATVVDELGESVSSGQPLAPIGAVMGATYPEHLRRARELMPKAVFLLPGVGAQGGSVEDLAPAFEPHKAAGLVTASRGIVNAYIERGGEPKEAAKAQAARLRELAWSIN